MKNKNEKLSYIYVDNDIQIKMLDYIRHQFIIDIKYRNSLKEQMNDMLNFKQIKFWQGSQNEFWHLYLSLAGVPIKTKKGILYKIKEENDQLIWDKREAKLLELRGYEKVEPKDNLIIKTHKGEFSLETKNRDISGSRHYAINRCKEHVNQNINIDERQL